MTTLQRLLLQLPRVPLAVLALTLVLVVAGGPLETIRTALVGEATESFPDDAEAAVVQPDEDLDRLRANVAFWGARFASDARDFVSASRLAGAAIDLARATGDLSMYVTADDAVAGALAVHPEYAPARGHRGVVLQALHRFAEARDWAAAILKERPDDTVALATLGDAALELGDVAAAGEAYRRLAGVSDSAAVRARASRLAFITGETSGAIAHAQEALAMAHEEGSTGSDLAWYAYMLGDVQLAAGDPAGARSTFEDALAEDPRSHLARSGLARISAAHGRLDEAIAYLDAAIDAVPLPETIARRADLYELRDGPGDARQAADDRSTVLAIAELAGDASGVYDRNLSLFLATTGIDAARALRLAQGEIAVRRDVYGYDALGWALLATGQAEKADAALRTAVAFGTRDASLLYHAGLAAAAAGDPDRAGTLLREALDLDGALDPVSAARARTTLADLP